MVDDCFVLKEESSFRTSYVAPDKLIYTRIPESGVERSYEIDGKRGRIVSSNPEHNKPFKMPLTNTQIDWNNLDPHFVLSGAGGVTYSTSDFTLPLMIRNAQRGNWTKSKNFRLIGTKVIGDTECYVIRSVRVPDLLCIDTENFTIKRIEQGAQYFEQFIFNSAEMLAKLLVTINSARTELLEEHQRSNRERICNYTKVDLVT